MKGQFTDNNTEILIKHYDVLYALLKKHISKPHFALICELLELESELTRREE